MASIIREVGETFGALVKGFSVTFRNMFTKTVTENYPYEKVHFQPRYRGIHVLHRDESGLEKCVGCFLCAAACPANCIYIEAAENTDVNRISAGSATPPSITSTIRAAFFAVIAWKRVPRMRSRTDMALSWPPTTLIPWCIAKNSFSNQ